MLSRTGSVFSETAICGSAVVITVESICCMMIAEATIMATTFGFVSGDMGDARSFRYFPCCSWITSTAARCASFAAGRPQ